MADRFQSMLAGLSSTGMTTVEISRKTGLSRTTLYKLKNGEVRSPAFDTYCRIERVHKAAVPTTISRKV